MAEAKKEKKKTTTTKTTTTKKSSQTKTTPKKTATKTTTTKSSSKKPTTKKVAAKTTTKTVTKSAPKKKVTKTSSTSKVKKPVVKLTEEELLEKTIIFDGRQNQNLAEVVEKLEEKNIVLEDKVIKRSKGKKIAIIVLTVLIFAIIIATTAYVVKHELSKGPIDNKAETLNSNIYKKVVENYKTIGAINKENSKNNDESKVSIEDIEYDNISTITLKEFEEKILDKEDMTILISSTTCYPCITFEPTISEVYSKLNKTIYRINITAMSKEEKERFRTYYKFTLTPTIFTIKDGYVKSEITGNKTSEELTNWVNQNI